MRDLFSAFADAGGAFERELIVDCFAGGGGASTGIFLALGRHPDVAVNHDREALAMHRANHPDTVHVSKNIYKVDPIDLVGRRPVGLLWASPDCKHFSKAKGGRPVKRNIRDLAWTVVAWARRARPRVIMLENVEEFKTWGPVVPDGKGGYRPCAERMGRTFSDWIGALRRLGYKVEWKELRACDYGAPTIRKRLFVIARRDGLPIVWPEPTHGEPGSEEVRAGKRLPWLGAHTVIDWSLPCPSIFETSEEIFERYGLRAKRPLADNTLKRLARGVRRYVLDAKEPFFVTYAQQGGGNRSAADPLHTVTASAKDFNALVVAYMAQHNNDKRRAGGVNPGRSARAPMATLTAAGAQSQVVAAHLTKFYAGAVGSDLQDPAPTITANSYHKRPGGAAPLGLAVANMVSLRGSYRRDYSAMEPVRAQSAGGSHDAVAAAFLTRQFGNSVGSNLHEPAGTVTAGGGGKTAVVAAFLDTYYGTDQAMSLGDPMGADTTRDRRSFVTVEFGGEAYAVADIGMRMLTPRERFRAQGFPDSYVIDHGVDERGERLTLTKSAQGRMCGNSVCPPLAKALAQANCAWLAVGAGIEAGDVA